MFSLVWKIRCQTQNCVFTCSVQPECCTSKSRGGREEEQKVPNLTQNSLETQILFVSRPYRHKIFTISQPETSFHQLQQLVTIVSYREHAHWHGESTFSEGLCNGDTKHEHIYKQVIPEYPFLKFLSPPCSGFFAGIQYGLFSKTTFWSLHVNIQITMGSEENRWFVLCLRGIEQIKEQNPAQPSQSIHTSPSCSVRTDALLDNLPSSQLLPVKPGQHLHSSVVTVR